VLHSACASSSAATSALGTLCENLAELRIVLVLVNVVDSYVSTCER
jgi:hypothetical protein